MHGVRVFLATTLIAAAAVAEDQVNYARIDYSKAATHEADVEEMSITGVFATYSPIVSKISGHVIVADPPDGCGRIKLLQRMARGSRFVLLARLTTNSTCTAMEQNYNAWNAGAAAIVNMAPDVDSNYIWILQDTESDKRLPSTHKTLPHVAVSGQSGSRLEAMVRAGPGRIHISTASNQQEEEFLVVDLAITVVCIAVAIFVLLYAYRVGRSICLQTVELEAESRPDPEQTARLRARVSEILIQDLPVTKYSCPEGENVSNVDSCEKADCAICLDSFDAGVNVRTLSCNHVFHVDCIDPWLLDHHNCPLCKDDIIAPRADLVLPQLLEEEGEDESQTTASAATLDDADDMGYTPHSFSLRMHQSPSRCSSSSSQSSESENAPFIVMAHNNDAASSVQTDAMNSLSVGCSNASRGDMSVHSAENTAPEKAVTGAGGSPTAHMLGRSMFTPETRRVTERLPDLPSKGSQVDLTQV